MESSLCRAHCASTVPNDFAMGTESRPGLHVRGGRLQNRRRRPAGQRVGALPRLLSSGADLQELPAHVLVWSRRVCEASGTVQTPDFDGSPQVGFLRPETQQPVDRRELPRRRPAADEVRQGLRERVAPDLSQPLTLWQLLRSVQDLKSFDCFGSVSLCRSFALNQEESLLITSTKRSFDCIFFFFTCYTWTKYILFCNIETQRWRCTFFVHWQLKAKQHREINSIFTPQFFAFMKNVELVDTKMLI